MAYFDERPERQKLINQIQILAIKLDMTIVFDAIEMMSYGDLRELYIDLLGRDTAQSFPSEIHIQGVKQQKESIEY